MEELVRSHDCCDDDADIVLAEYDSDTAVARGSCDTEDRCVHSISIVY